MSDHFAAFDIKHLSVSSLNKWQGERGAWVASYLYGLWGDEGAGLWRGKAVEAAIDGWHNGASDEKCLEHMSREFENGAQGDLSDDVEKERSALIPMFREAQAAWGKLDLGPVKASQIRTECWLGGIDVPLVGYIDFALERNEMSVDLKTTHRCPSSLSLNHGMQIASYARARNESRAGILYVTAKKHAYFEIGPDEIEGYIKELQRRAKGLSETLKTAYMRSLLDKKDAKHVLASMCPPDPDSFYWSEGSLATALNNVPAWQ